MPTYITGELKFYSDKECKTPFRFDFARTPEIGRTYQWTAYLKNESEYPAFHVRILHDYGDLKIEPSYIESIKPSEVIEVTITWRPYCEQGISEKIGKDGEFEFKFSITCQSEVIQNV